MGQPRGLQAWARVVSRMLRFFRPVGTGILGAMIAWNFSVRRW